MGITPAEPLSYRAAKLALKFDEIGAVYWAVFITSANCYSRAFTADKLFFFEIVIFIDRIALFHTTEVRVLTFETHIVRQLLNCKSFKVIVESVFRILEARIFV